MRNPIHNYFSKKNNKCAKCTICSTLLSVPNDNTTNLIAHLKRKHEKIYQNFLEEKKKPSLVPQKLNFVIRKENVSLKTNQEQLNLKIMKFIVSSFSPSQIVENKYFRELMSDFNYGKDLKKEKFYRNTQLNEYSDVIHKNVSKEIRNEATIGGSLIFDFWKGINSENYLEIIFTFINEEFELKIRALDCIGFNNENIKKTGEYIASIITDVIDTYNINTRSIVAVTTDNDSKLLKANKILNFPQIFCLSHSIQLIINSVIKENSNVLNLITKCKDVATFFHYSDTAVRKLIEISKLNNFEKFKIPTCTEIRRGSKLKTVKRVIKAKPFLNSVLAELQTTFNLLVPSLFTKEEFVFLEDLSVLLTFLEEAIVLFNAKKGAPITKVWCICEELDNQIRNCVVRTQLVSFKSCLIKGLGNLPSSDSPFYLITMYLNPLFKTKLFFLNKKKK